MKFATLFSGGGGVDIGLMAAGMTPAWAVEYDAQIAGVYRQNIGDHVIVDDVRCVDYAALPRVDWLHASPVCTRASVANSGASESPEDVETAAAVVRAIGAQRPQVFTLENVWQYRNFAAFRLILDALAAGGYFYDFNHVNCANYGVPSTRKRLLLRASRGLLPPLPQPVPWVGWYAAIEDLIPSLPDAQLAPWQLVRLPAELRESLLVPGILNGESERITLRSGNHPSPTVTVHQRDIRAVLLDMQNSSRDATVRAASEPSITVTHATGTRPSHLQAVLSARTVSMTPRCLARFQSVPDWYVLPDKRTLAAKVIGNMVPPLLMQRVAETLRN